jgi:CheY-like chemotaxis protein
MSLVPLLALVIEDDGLQRALLSDVLREQGMDVIECDSAESGELVLARTGLELSVLITDVELAGAMDGISLARFALQNFPALRVVIVSGQSNLTIPPGATFLPKPLRPAQLCMPRCLRPDVAVSGARRRARMFAPAPHGEDVVCTHAHSVTPHPARRQGSGRDAAAIPGPDAVASR